MKKAGIVCDNYKLKAFKKRLEADGYDFHYLPFCPGNTSIFIKIEDHQVKDIDKLCREVELGIKRGN